MSNRVNILALVLLVLALCGWAGVGYSAHMIKETAVQRTNDSQAALTKANQAAHNRRVEALAASTKDERDRLTQIAGADVVSVIDTIDAAGKTAGITAKVSDAAVAGSQQLGKSGDSLRGVVFNVQGEGTFTQVMHAAALYEKLPLLSVIDSMDIERSQSTDPKAAPWRIIVRIRVLTLVQVST
jgi:hypothetical protein